MSYTLKYNIEFNLKNNRNYTPNDNVLGIFKRNKCKKEAKGFMLRLLKELKQQYKEELPESVLHLEEGEYTEHSFIYSIYGRLNNTSSLICTCTLTIE